MKDHGRRHYSLGALGTVEVFIVGIYSEKMMSTSSAAIIAAAGSGSGPHRDDGYGWALRVAAGEGGGGRD